MSIEDRLQATKQERDDAARAAEEQRLGGIRAQITSRKTEQARLRQQLEDLVERKGAMTAAKQTYGIERQNVREKHARLTRQFGTDVMKAEGMGKPKEMVQQAGEDDETITTFRHARSARSASVKAANVAKGQAHEALPEEESDEALPGEKGRNVIEKTSARLHRRIAELQREIITLSLQTPEGRAEVLARAEQKVAERHERPDAVMGRYLEALRASRDYRGEHTQSFFVQRDDVMDAAAYTPEIMQQAIASYWGKALDGIIARQKEEKGIAGVLNDEAMMNGYERKLREAEYAVDEATRARETTLQTIAQFLEDHPLVAQSIANHLHASHGSAAAGEGRKLAERFLKDPEEMWSAAGSGWRSRTALAEDIQKGNRHLERIQSRSIVTALQDASADRRPYGTEPIQTRIPNPETILLQGRALKGWYESLPPLMMTDDPDAFNASAVTVKIRQLPQRPDLANAPKTLSFSRATYDALTGQRRHHRFQDVLSTKEFEAKRIDDEAAHCKELLPAKVRADWDTETVAVYAHQAGDIPHKHAETEQIRELAEKALPVLADISATLQAHAEREVRISPDSYHRGQVRCKDDLTTIIEQSRNEKKRLEDVLAQMNTKKTELEAKTGRWGRGKRQKQITLLATEIAATEKRLTAERATLTVWVNTSNAIGRLEHVINQTGIGDSVPKQSITVGELWEMVQTQVQELVTSSHLPPAEEEMYQTLLRLRGQAAASQKAYDAERTKPRYV